MEKKRAKLVGAKRWSRGVLVQALVLAEAAVLLWTIPVLFALHWLSLLAWSGLSQGLNRLGAWGKRQSARIKAAREDGPGSHWSAAESAPWERGWPGAVKAWELAIIMLSGHSLSRRLVDRLAKELSARPELAPFCARAGCNPLSPILWSVEKEDFEAAAEPLAGAFWSARAGWIGGLIFLKAGSCSISQLMRIDWEGDPQLPAALARMERIAFAQREASELGESVRPSRSAPGRSGRKSL